MNRRCAWCGRSLNGTGVEPPADAQVTHGICTPCRHRLTDHAGMPITEFLDSLDEPVLLMDADHTVGMANDPALALMGRSAGEVLGERTGTVFDCENAHLPGGCGATIHCSGCTIRSAVAHTHLTGEPCLSVPATLRVVEDAELTDVALVISTARVDDRVLLKIERFER